VGAYWTRGSSAPPASTAGSGLHSSMPGGKGSSLTARRQYAVACLRLQYAALPPWSRHRCRQQRRSHRLLDLSHTARATATETSALRAGAVSGVGGEPLHAGSDAAASALPGLRSCTPLRRCDPDLGMRSASEMFHCQQQLQQQEPAARCAIITRQQRRRLPRST
jgi:hypothetical protein